MAFPFIPALLEALGGATAAEGVAGAVGATEGAAAAGTAAAGTAAEGATGAAATSRFTDFAKGALRSSVGRQVATHAGQHAMDVLTDSNTEARNPTQ